MAVLTDVTYCSPQKLAEHSSRTEHGWNTGIVGLITLEACSMLCGAAWVEASCQADFFFQTILPNI